MGVLGLDIGGANLKAAHSSGGACSKPFALWKDPAGLADAVRQVVGVMPPAEAWAVTMTGELCDCFEIKRRGVRAILEAVDAVRDGVPVRVWTNQGRFVGMAEARAAPLQVAAANWLALATFAGRFAPEGPALLIDIGSTTADLVPLADGRPVPGGRTDPERLRAGELVYTGVRRTPVCAILGVEGAAEWFATTRDVYLVLGHLAEEPADRDTADGRPATREFALARLARMICADAETCSVSDVERLALRVSQRQESFLQGAIERVVERLGGEPATVVLSGSGEFLARAVVATVPALARARVVSLGEQRGAEVSQAACAHALAVLAAEQGHEDV